MSVVYKEGIPALIDQTMGIQPPQQPIRPDVLTNQHVKTAKRLARGIRYGCVTIRIDDGKVVSIGQTRDHSCL